MSTGRNRSAKPGMAPSAPTPARGRSHGRSFAPDERPRCHPHTPRPGRRELAWRANHGIEVTLVGDSRTNGSAGRSSGWLAAALHRVAISPCTTLAGRVETAALLQGQQRR
jgi:hypothetical protein